jgi:hypothetical protein
MTLPPSTSDASSAAPGSPANNSPGRRATEGLRPLAATALLAGNGVLLFLGVSDLIFVVSGWVSQFGARSEATFGTFAGPVAITLPLLATLLATHVSPPLPRCRAILVAALAEYAVSAFFGVITYLGGFAHGVFSVRATFDWLLGRAVWLAFLTIAITVVYRVFRGMYPPAPVYRYGPTVYGRPYPGQPTYPRTTTYGPGPVQRTSDASVVDVPTAESPMPPGALPPEPTQRIPPPAAEETRPMPPVAGGGTPPA